jgi:hypothetical protein
MNKREYCMNNKNGKFLLAVVAVCCLVPAAFADRDHRLGCDDRRSRKDCQQVPEGGSNAVYLLGAGLTCVGAMFLRSKVAKPAQS